jgi:hypothetical protein
LEASRDHLRQFVGPGIAAVIVKRGVAEAHRGFFVQEIHAAKTTVREYIGAGEGHAILAGAKFIQIKHTFILALENFPPQQRWEGKM